MTASNEGTFQVTVTDNLGQTKTYTATSSFAAPSASQLTFPEIDWLGSDNSVVRSKAFALTRNGKVYRGTMQFYDGAVSTSWRDYATWVQEISDPNDLDADGIPDLSDDVPVPPAISKQPEGTNAPVGGKVTFTVAATGTAALKYQWKKDGTAISGATTNSYSIASAQLASAGTYTVTVTNLAGTVVSAPAVLTVFVPAVAPAITALPKSATLSAGQTLALSVTATGTAPLRYQWLKGGVALPNATNQTLSIASVVFTNAGSYSVTVSNSGGQATSTAAVIVVNSKPLITSQPADQVVAVGAQANFSVTAVGNATITYKWRKNGVVISGATLPSYTIASCQTNHAGDYTAIIANSRGSVTSLVARLTVNATTVMPEFKTLTRRSDGSLTFRLTLNSGAVSALEFSTDFINWSTLQTFTPTTNTVERIEPKPTAPAGYFRLRQ